MTDEEMAARTQERQAQEKKPRIPGVRRGTHRRRARAVGMHMSTFWAANDADRRMMHEISKAGRR